jgi:hypothetical protein
VLTFKGQYDTRIDTGEDYATVTLSDVWDMSPTSRPKAKAPAIIPSTYHAFNGREHAVQRAQGQFVALTGDIDKGNVSKADLVDQTRSLFGPEAAIFIYSTGSATPDDKRWRVIAPLNEPVPFARWNEAQEAFFRHMEASGVPMDWSLARAAQPVYLPNVPPERRNGGGEPLFYESYAHGEVGIPL